MRRCRRRASAVCSAWGAKGRPRRGGRTGGRRSGCTDAPAAPPPVGAPPVRAPEDAGRAPACGDKVGDGVSALHVAGDGEGARRVGPRVRGLQPAPAACLRGRVRLRCAGENRAADARRRIEAETVPPPARTAVLGHAPSPDSRAGVFRRADRAHLESERDPDAQGVAVHQPPRPA